jgi:hypothetical protein
VAKQQLRMDRCLLWGLFQVMWQVTVEQQYQVAQKFLGMLLLMLITSKLQSLGDQLSWPMAEERPFSAISQGRDGQMGIDGNIHSDGVKNAVGQTLTRFVGAYAAGSMNTGAFGANQGGNVNGMRNAIAQTATDRANSMGETMQKERKWIELESGTETIAVLSQAFSFRDAGATYGN